MKKIFKWLLLVILLTIPFNFFLAINTPKFIMMYMMSQAEKPQGKNKVVHMARPDEKSRRVVRPSPDMLYSYCVYDLSKGPMLILAPRPDSYFSAAVYSDKTDNIFVQNDLQMPRSGAKFIIASDYIKDFPGTKIVVTPSKKGVVLFRWVIENPQQQTQLAQLRQQVKCIQ